MDMKQFLKELSLVKNKFHWFNTSGVIRGRLKVGDTNLYFDPVTAVHFNKIGRSIPLMMYRKAALEIDLSREDADEIAFACDGYDCKKELKDKIISILFT